MKDLARKELEKICKSLIEDPEFLFLEHKSDLFKSKIYHYISSPIDYYKGYIDFFDLKEKIKENYKETPFQIHGMNSG